MDYELRRMRQVARLLHDLPLLLEAYGDMNAAERKVVRARLRRARVNGRKLTRYVERTRH